MEEFKKKLQDRNDIYFSAIIPPQGNCDTMEGEMIRAINKIIYRHYNDGDYFYEGYGCVTAGPAHSFLVQGCPLSHILLPIFENIEFKGDDAYEKGIYEVLEVILDYVDSKEGKYEKSDVDMLTFTPLFMDDEPERCWGCGYEEEYCDCYEEDDEDGFDEGFG